MTDKILSPEGSCSLWNEALAGAQGKVPGSIQGLWLSVTSKLRCEIFCAKIDASHCKGWCIGSRQRSGIKKWSLLRRRSGAPKSAKHSTCPSHNHKTDGVQPYVKVFFFLSLLCRRLIYAFQKTYDSQNLKLGPASREISVLVDVPAEEILFFVSTGLPTNSGSGSVFIFRSGTPSSLYVFWLQNSNVVELYSRLQKNKDQITYYNSGIGTYAKDPTSWWVTSKQSLRHRVDRAFARYGWVTPSAWLIFLTYISLQFFQGKGPEWIPMVVGKLWRRRSHIFVWWIFRCIHHGLRHR